MKYLSKLSEEQLIELVKIYCGNNFVEVKSITKIYIGFEICVIVKDDDELIEEEYDLFDYKVVFWDKMGKDKSKICLSKYRRKMLEWAGSRYALDYLLNTLD